MPAFPTLISSSPSSSCVVCFTARNGCIPTLCIFCGNADRPPDVNEANFTPLFEPVYGGAADVVFMLELSNAIKGPQRRLLLLPIKPGFGCYPDRAATWHHSGWRLTVCRYSPSFPLALVVSRQFTFRRQPVARKACGSENCDYSPRKCERIENGCQASAPRSNGTTSPPIRTLSR